MEMNLKGRAEKLQLATKAGKGENRTLFLDGHWFLQKCHLLKHKTMVLGGTKYLIIITNSIHARHMI